MSDETNVEESNEESTEVEETTPSPSEEIKPEAEEKTVPYDRFQEVIKEKNQYKELVDTMESKPVEPVKTPTDFAGDTEDALKLIDERANNIVSKRLQATERKRDLDDTISKNPDFFKFQPIIKAKIEENPNLAWSDAYKLAKYDTSQNEAKEAGKQEAYDNIVEKKKGNVESASKAKTPGSGDSIDPQAKGPDGKYLYTAKELEDLLPKA